MSGFRDELKGDRGFWKKVLAGRKLTKSEQEKFFDLKLKYGLGSDGTVTTQDELAELLGVSRRTVIRWKNEGMPVEDDGKYDPVRILEWREGVLGEVDDDDQDVSPKIFWDVEFRKFRAQLAELDLKKAQGEVISVGLVETLLVDRATELKKSLLARAKRLSTILARRSADEVYQVLEDDVLDTLRTYSRPSPVIEEVKVAAAAVQGSVDEEVTSNA